MSPRRPVNHQAIQRLKQGRTLERHDDEGSTTFRWDDSDAVFRQHSQGNTPYSGETREAHFELTESEIRVILLRSEELVTTFLTGAKAQDAWERAWARRLRERAADAERAASEE